MRKLLLTAAVVCGLVVGVGSAGASGTTATAVSTNWSGYAVTGASPFTAVSARRVQPTASCTAGKATSSAFWVGLGGFSRSATSLEQIGTDADCDASGNVSYSAWYEILPAASTPLSVAVSPGDTISASVMIDGTTVSFQL